MIGEGEMKEHPYQVMPDLSAEEYEELKADIAERGVMVPIEFDEDGNILDGHHRLRACQELGITDYPTVTREGMSEQEKILHAFSLNTARRQLTKAQKVAAIQGLLERDPSLSDRKIARAVGVSHPTVGKYRKQLEDAGQVVKFTTRKGEDGKEYHIADLSERTSFTCCICGREFPACYVKSYRGEYVNAWGYDPWPIMAEGDCCDACAKSLIPIIDRMPLEVRNQHYMGPRWREMLEVWEGMRADGYGWQNNREAYDPVECESEFERRLADIGISID